MYHEVKIWKWLKANSGFNDCAIAAIMGNIEAESNGLPNNLENRANTALGMTDEEYTAAVDNGTWSRTDFSQDRGVYAGYGLFQHTYYSRKLALYDFAKAKGVSIGNLEMQLEFMLQELKDDYKTVYNSLYTAANVAAPCIRFLQDYERPANASAQESKRTEMAQAIYDRNHKEETTQADNKPDNTVTNRLLDIVARQNQITEDLKELVKLCQMQ